MRRGPSLLLCAFVLTGDPLVGSIIIGHRKRVGLLASQTVVLIGEFPILFAAIRISLGHVGVDAFRPTTLAGLIRGRDQTAGIRVAGNG